MLRTSEVHPTILICLLLFCFLPIAHANTLVVEDVTDGNTLIFGSDLTARFAGVIAPEVGEPGGMEAWDFVKRRLHGVKVALYTISDTSLVSEDNPHGLVSDSTGRQYYIVKYGEEFETDFGALLIEKGLARIEESSLTPDLQHYHDLQTKAQEARSGIWAE